MSAVSFLKVIRTLTKARDEQKKSQAEIAFALKVTRQAVAAWEAGTTFPTADKMFAWAAYLGFDLQLIRSEP